MASASSSALSPRDVFNLYLGVFYQLFGTFHDARFGFRKGLVELDEAQKGMLEDFSRTSPEHASIEYLDSCQLYYGSGPPDQPGSVLHYASTQGDYKQRNAEGGSNHVFLGNMTLIAVYQYWEDQYRNELATALKRHRDQIRADVFGDIRQIRHSIVHHGGIASEKVAAARVLKWFAAGELITIDDEKLRQAFEEMRKVPELLGF